MALIQFTVALVGADAAVLPVQVTTAVPVPVAQAAGPSTINFEVQNTLTRSVIIENIAAQAITGDPTLIDISVLDTVMALAAGETVASSMTVTPNQPVFEGVDFDIEMTGAEA